MAHRAHLRLLLVIVVSFAVLLSLHATNSARGELIARNAVHARSVDIHMLASSPPHDGKLAAAFGKWNDDDDPDDILPAESVSIALPLLTTGFGRRVGYAVAQESLVSAAFPRGPPAL